MVMADPIMIPAALFSAISLRLGTVDHFAQTGAWPYFAAVIIALPLFARLGLYRAVVRYMGGKVARTVLAGVSLSALLMLPLDFVVALGLCRTPRSSSTGRSRCSMSPAADPSCGTSSCLSA